MIKTLKQLIKDHSEWLQSPSSELSFLKLSTPASGSKLHQGKVLMFVFENENDLPTLCVKTARTYPTGKVVWQNNTNLLLLKQGVKGTDHEGLFAKPLHIHDDGKNVFSVESVCPGNKFAMSNIDVDLVVNKYIEWQTLLAKNSEKKLGKNDLQKIVYESIDKLDLQEETKQGLKDYFNNLSVSEKIELPEIIQHGDMTPDNVLIDGNNVSIVDYDYVGFSTAPGFDLFHFLSKSKALDIKYFHKYFKEIGANVESFEALFFLYYMQESLRKGTGNKKSHIDIIADFESLIKR